MISPPPLPFPMVLRARTIRGNWESDVIATGTHTLFFPVRLFAPGPLKPSTTVQSQKPAPPVNRRLAARLLYIEDLNPQQTVRVDLSRVRRHRRDTFAFGLNGLVALKADEVGDGLAWLQSGQEIDAFVARAESGNVKN